MIINELEVYFNKSQRPSLISLTSGIKSIRFLARLLSLTHRREFTCQLQILIELPRTVAWRKSKSRGLSNWERKISETDPQTLSQTTLSQKRPGWIHSGTRESSLSTKPPCPKSLQSTRRSSWSPRPTTKRIKTMNQWEPSCSINPKWISRTQRVSDTNLCQRITKYGETFI